MQLYDNLDGNNIVACQTNSLSMVRRLIIQQSADSVTSVEMFNAGLDIDTKQYFRE